MAVGSCNPVTDTIGLTVVVPAGIDTVQPIFYITDLLNNPIADNDPATTVGTAVTLGTLGIPEGACSHQDVFYVYGFDDCDGGITELAALAATVSTVPEGNSPATQVSVSADGNGRYVLEVQWGVGTSTVRLIGRDASGNIAHGSEGLRLTAQIEDNRDPEVRVLGNSQYTIPVCATTVSGTIAVQVEDQCDQPVDFDNLQVSFGGASGVINFTGSNYREYLVTFPQEGSYTLSVGYTDAGGNQVSYQQTIVVQRAMANEPPVIYAFTETYTAPACADGLLLNYGFMITDDCEPIDTAAVEFEGGSSGLTLANGFAYVEHQGDRVCYFEVSGPMISGDHYITIRYGGQTATRLLRVMSNPDLLPPQLYHPAGAMLVEVAYCDGLPVSIPLAIAAEDDCGGEVSLQLTLLADSTRATISSGAAGYTAIVNEAGTYPVTITATDASGNMREAGFELVVRQTLQSDLHCIDTVVVELSGTYSRPFTADELLTGSFGCLSSQLFNVQILDGYTANGHILDGPGLFPYRISLLLPPPVSGFTGPLAAGQWESSLPANGSGILFSPDTLTLTGPAGSYCHEGDGILATVAMPAAGSLSFSYRWQNADPGWDTLLIRAGDEILLQSTAASLQGSLSRRFEAGEQISLLVRSTDCAMGGGVLYVTQWLFVPDDPAAGISFTNCRGYIRAESDEPADVSCPPTVAVCFDNEVVFLDALATVPAADSPRSTFFGPGVSAFDAAAGLYNFDPMAAGTGQHTILYQYQYLDGHVDSCTFVIDVLPSPEPVITGDLVHCGDTSVLVAGQGFAFYEWNTGDMTASINISPVEPTLYEVVVSDENGCTGTASVTVAPAEPPAAVISGDLTLCRGDSTTLSAAAGLAYAWSNGDTLAHISVQPLVTTNYRLTVTNEAGCSSSAEVTVVVNPLPAVDISGDTLVCTAGGSSLTASGGGSYLWSTGATSPGILAAIPGTHSYAVTVTDANGCQNHASLTVTIGDFERPVMRCADDQTVVLAAADCSYTVGTDEWHPEVSDNCSLEQLSFVLSGASVGSGTGSLSGTVFNAGITILRWLASDAAGNSDSCSLLVEVRDQTPPVLACVALQEIVFNGQSVVSIDPATLVSLAIDACGALSLSASLSSVSCAQLGQSLPVTVTATDAQGNSSSCQTVVSVTGLPCQWTAPVDGINCEGESSVSYDVATATYTLYVDDCQQSPPANVDELSYAYLPLCGNRSYIEARIDSIEGTGFAGISIRESSSPGARKVQLMLSETRNTVRRELRTSTNGNVAGINFTRNNTRWLKLWRRDNQVIGYVSSTNTASFSQLFAINMTFGSCAELGLVLVQTTPGPVRAVFSGVSTMLQPLQPEDPGLGQGSELQPALTERSIFPNPTQGQVWLDLSRFLGQSLDIEVQDMYSRRLRSVTVEPLEDALYSMDLSDYASGVYLVRITDARGGVHTGRVVLQR